MRGFRVVNVTSDSRKETKIRRADEDGVAGGDATPPSESDGERTDSRSHYDTIDLMLGEQTC